MNMRLSIKGTVFSAFLVLGFSTSCADCWQHYQCCTKDSDCDEGFLCAGGICNSRCFTDEQCAKGEYCDRSKNYCAGSALPDECLVVSVGDANYIDGAIASPDRNIIDGNHSDSLPLDSALPDRSYRDRSLRDVIETDSAQDASVCQDDNFEENDTRTHASQISADTIEAILCPGDRDWFSIDRERTDVVHVSIDCSQASAVLRVSLILPNDQTMVVACHPGSTNTQVQLYIDAPGPAFVEISGENLPSPSPYVLHYWLESSAMDCGSDAFELNNTIADAYSASVQQGSYWLGTICSTDVDYFYVDLDAGYLISVTQVIPQGCPGDTIAILGPDGTTVLAEDTSGAAQRFLQATTSSQGRYYIKVTSTCINSTYYTIFGGLQRCGDDQYEQNDSFQSSSEIQSEVINATACPGNDDFFSIQYGASDFGPIHLDLRLESSVNLEFELSGPSYEPLIGQFRRNNQAELEWWPLLAIGTYYARVRVGSGAGVRYTLQFCKDDIFEPNDNVGDLVSITNPGTYQAILCRGDRDMYEISAIENDNIYISFIAIPTPVDVVLTLVRQIDEVEVAAGEPASTGRTLVYTAPKTENYLLVIDAPSGGTTSYGMTISH